ncbi:hypothetical protein J1N35_000249 [Gossypium stocksii]|uniref:Uncharacterized protein n=1 Tax=Gossypium stocksii TaxID=47602 RepID=A0A9D3WHZ5_9ROSI|nr:hypothetical protein J1N35_000249 [Gossypium stocksii]
MKELRVDVLNPAKTEIFASGILGEEMEDILRITGIKMGRLPVRYLVTRRLTVKDCAPLIDKMSEGDQANVFKTLLEGQGLTCKGSKGWMEFHLSSYKVLKLGCIHRCGGNWDHWLRWALTRLKGKPLLTLILKLAWNAFVHLIWAERSWRQFTSQQF